ncbi:MAG: thiamine-phosphate kinase [Pseudomonadota bacterium]|nr:thiamine-phosphate kinase [Pseudomonadota bacterium]MDE3037789.1 thiamine-phosphate kinase [Pseudomonadota bacterium]
MDEFDLIKAYFAPLAKGFSGGLNLADDAALIHVPSGSDLAVTTDAINRGVHFVGNEDPALIARKLLRVNLSDLAAMGATPLCYFLTLMLPPLSSPSPAGGTEGGWNHWLKRFAEGLREDQSLFGIRLAGGDTSATKEGMSFSVTALGGVAAGRALRRSGARPGDAIYLSGTLGDGALGLLRRLRPGASPGRGSRANGERSPARRRLAGDDALFLEQRYLLPQPRLELGQKLIGVASACMDVSDGLVQDLGHICEVSGVGATIQRDKLPLSDPARKLIEADKNLWDFVLGGGDDYELLFTAPPEKEMLIRGLSAELELPLTAIGNITEGAEVEVLDATGKSLIVAHKGFRHFHNRHTT